jgi:Sap, sulfolipid-1-addressing protein
MGSIFGLSIVAAIYPTLLACVTVILLLPRPERLLLGFWLGAMAMSVTCGLIIVLALGGSSGATSTTKHSISPIAEITLGAILLLLALVFFSGRDQRVNARVERRRESKAKAKAEKPPSKAMQRLQRGSPRTTFVVGACIIGVPGVSYLTAMDLLARQHVSTFTSVLVVLAWNVIMLLLLEIPIVAYAFAPESTGTAVESFKSWLTRDEGRIAYWCSLIAGAALLALGVVHLVD